jgi:hypothetical protein
MYNPGEFNPLRDAASTGSVSVLLKEDSWKMGKHK